MGIKGDDTLDYILSVKREGLKSFRELAKKAYDSLDDALKPYIDIKKLTEEDTVRNVVKPGRNDTCPCGSGRKYKKCCESNTA